MRSVADLTPVLIGVVLMVGYRRAAALIVKSAVRFHGTEAKKRRAESQVSLVRAFVMLVGALFVALAVVDYMDTTG